MGASRVKSVALFGATGSVGTSTLNLIRRQPDLYRASVLTAATNVEAMAALIEEFSPTYAVMADVAAAKNLRDRIEGSTIVLAGPAGLLEAAQAPCHIHVAAIVGAAGLGPTFAAVQAGYDVALANKEALVCAGGLMTAAAKASGAKLLPVDSEHNAIFQCWEERNRAAIKSVQLTASGGPFRGWSAGEVANATLAQALRHPNWSMGAKITIDSATLANKALEMIEAKWLFDLRADQLDVVVHPQSIIHSCVTYADGSTLAQMGRPDMRTPIAYCLAYPARAAMGGETLSLTDLGALTFEAPDLAVFPALGIGREAMAAEGTAIAFNAANEVFNAAVRAGQLPFGQLIPRVQQLIAVTRPPIIGDLDTVQALDREVRARAQAALN